MRKTTRNLLAAARVEKDVENAYREEIRHHRPKAVITSPYGTDGYALWDTVRLLLETKYDVDLKGRLPVCNVLGQMILYLHKFQSAGEPLPNVLLVGDRNECFVLGVQAIQDFLDLPIDWSVAPSGGSPELTRALVEGVNLLPYVYDVDEHLDFRQVLDKCETLAAGEIRRVRATETNLTAIFTYWVDRVFTDKKLTAVEQVDVFLRCLFQPQAVYLHPTKRGVLVVPGYDEGVRINADQYRSFFDHFRQGYKPSQVERFYAMKDRLVEDDSRRRQGAFFTPRLWVDEAHKEIEKVLGPDWRRDCIVWDPAAGTANLTRDYDDWGSLICSTAERPDVAVIKEQGWHAQGEHEVFQYDFLNPDVESPFFEDGALNVLPASVDKKLRDAAAAGKRLVFFMNPPYGTANNAGTKEGDHKAGIALTVVNGEMKVSKLGAPSQQLYAQFMFQCRQIAAGYGFKDSTVALYSKPTFMSSGSYKPFRHWWYKSHAYQGGFIFQASHFADVSGAWGILFTVWSEGATDVKADLPIRLTDERDFAVVTDGVKPVYNSDGREASRWVREPLKGLKGIDAPQMSSGLKVKEKGRGSLVPNALHFFGNNANNLQDSGTLVYNVSSADTRNNGLSVLPPNWRRAVALYGARKLVAGNWINDKDEYLVPDEAAPGYEQWVDDCHVYALLHGSNNCTAMRDVPYKGKSWQISNHWFWMTRDDALKALDTASTPTLYRDCKQHPAKVLIPAEQSEDLTEIMGDGASPSKTPWDLAQDAGDPYFAHVLPSLNLSPEAQDVLDKLQALWTLSLPHRESYAAGKPELHLTAWDSGVYQIKHLCRDLYPEEWKELQASFRMLADKLRPGVYEFGFLRK
jgi:hypothetical protein